MNLLIPLCDMPFLVDPYTRIFNLLPWCCRFVNTHIDGKTMCPGFFLNAANERTIFNWLDQGDSLRWWGCYVVWGLREEKGLKSWFEKPSRSKLLWPTFAPAAEAFLIRILHWLRFWIMEEVEHSWPTAWCKSQQGWITSCIRIIWKMQNLLQWPWWLGWMLVQRWVGRIDAATFLV